MSDVKCICGHEWQIHEWEGEGSYCLARTFPNSAFNTGEGVQCSCSGFVGGDREEQSVFPKCRNEFTLKHGYFCELQKGHSGQHEARCPNAQFHQCWPNEGEGAVVDAPAPDELAALRLRVEELTHERDQARKLIYGDHESHWGKYHTDEATKPSGGNIGSWYDSAVFWKRRAESAEKAGIKFGEFPDHFVATNARAEKA